MVSRNNRYLLDKVRRERECQRFGLRKLNIGVASVLLGTTLFFGSAGVAHADSGNVSTDNQNTETVTDKSANKVETNEEQSFNVISSDQTTNSNQNLGTVFGNIHTLNVTNIQSNSNTLNVTSSSNLGPQQANLVYGQSKVVSTNNGYEPSGPDIQVSQNPITDNVHASIQTHIHMDPNVNQHVNVSVWWDPNKTQDNSDGIGDYVSGHNVINGNGVFARATYTNLTGSNYYQSSDGQRVQIAKVVRTFSDATFVDPKNPHGCFVIYTKPGAHVEGTSPMEANAGLYNPISSVVESIAYYDPQGNRISIPDKDDVLVISSLNDAPNPKTGYGVGEGVQGVNGSIAYPYTYGKQYKNGWIGLDPEAPGSDGNGHAIVVGGSNHGMRFGYYLSNGQPGPGGFNQFAIDTVIPANMGLKYLRQHLYTRTINFVDAGGHRLRDSIVQTAMWNDFSMDGKTWTNDSTVNRTVGAVEIPKITDYQTNAGPIAQKIVDRNVSQNDIINVVYHSTRLPEALITLKYHDIVTGKDVGTGSMIITGSGNISYNLPSGYQIVNSSTLPTTVSVDNGGNFVFKNASGAVVSDPSIINVGKAQVKAPVVKEQSAWNVPAVMSSIAPAITYNSDFFSSDPSMFNEQLGQPTIWFNPATTTDVNMNRTNNSSDSARENQLISKYDLGTYHMNKFAYAEVTGKGVIGTSTFNLSDGAATYTNKSGQKISIGKIVRTYYDMDGIGYLGIFDHPTSLNDNLMHSPFEANLMLFGGAKSVAFKTDYYDLNGNKINLSDDEDIVPIANLGNDLANSDTDNGKHDAIRAVIITSGSTASGFNNICGNGLNAEYAPDVRNESIVIGGSNNGIRVGLVSSNLKQEIPSNIGNEFSVRLRLINYLSVDHFNQYTVTRTIHFVDENGTQLAPDKVQKVVWTIFTKDGKPASVSSNPDLNYTNGSYQKQFDAFDLPYIDGYTVDNPGSVNQARNVPFASRFNEDVTVYYHRSRQASVTVPVIKPGETVTITNGHGTKPEDYTRTVSRKITVTAPDGKVTSLPMQSFTFTRTAQWNPLTDKVTWNQWSENNAYQFADLTSSIPAIAGYTTVGLDNVKGITVNADYGDKTFNVTYSANDQTLTIHYMNGSTQVGTQTVTGKTDQIKILSFSLPGGYILSGTPAGSYKFTADKNQNMNVNVVPNVVKLDPKNYPGWPTDGAGHKPAVTDFDRTIKRTITINVPVGSVQTIDQSSRFTRSVSFNNANKTFIFGAWSPASSSFVSVPVPFFKGYMPSQTSIDPLTVTPNTKSSDVVINYTKNANEAVDKDHVPSDSNVDRNGFEKVVKRTITINAPGEKPVTQVQTVSFTRTAQLDPTNDKFVKWNDWDSSSYIIPGIVFKGFPGYTPNMSSVPSCVVTPNSSDLTVVVNYTANPSKITVNYMNGNSKVGSYVINGHFNESQTLGSSVITNLPTGYQLIDVTGSENKRVTFTTDDTQTVAIAVTPKIDNVSVNNIPTGYSRNDFQRTISRVVTIKVPTGSPRVTNQSVTFSRTGKYNEVTKTVVFDPWSENGSHTFDGVNVPAFKGYTPTQTSVVGLTVTPASQSSMVTVTYKKNPPVLISSNNVPIDSNVDRNGFMKVVTRYVTINVPHQAPIVKNRSVTFTRGAYIDAVSDQFISWGNWNVSNQILPAVTVPSHAGYTPDITNIGSLTVTPDSKDSTVVVNYKANPSKVAIDYMDGNTKVGSYTINGFVDGSQALGSNLVSNLPAGYRLVDATNVNKRITFTVDDTQAVTIAVTPKIDNVSANNVPAGYQRSDFQRTITRIVTINVPYDSPKVTNQSVTFSRTGKYNEITKVVTYDLWSENGSHTFGEVSVPTFKGYTASQDSVSSLVVTPGSQSNAVTVTYKKNPPVRIDVNHIPTDSNVDKTGFSKTVVRTINFVGTTSSIDPVRQSGTFTRTALIDAASDQFISWNPWNEAPKTFSTVSVPVVDGYIANVANVVSEAVTGDSNSSTVNVTYRPNGRLVPVDQNGQALTGVSNPQFSTDPSDPTKTVGQKVLSVSGYSLLDYADGTMISPDSDPTKNVNVRYIKNVTTTIEIVDTDAGKILASTSVTGKPGNKIGTVDAINNSLNALMNSGRFTLESNNLTDKSVLSNGIITINLKHKIDSMTRHYRVVENMPDGSQKVIIDMNVTLYKDADSDQWFWDGAHLDGNFANKILKPNVYQDLKGIEVQTGDGSFLHASVDSVRGYHHQALDFNTDESKVGVSAFFDKNDLDNVILDLFIGNVGSSELAESRDFHIGYVKNKYPVRVSYFTSDGSLVATSTANYDYLTSLDIEGQAPENYVLAAGQDTHLVVDAGDNDLDLVVVPKISQTMDYKTVTRTINIKRPNGFVKKVVQSVILSRVKETNLATGAVSYTTWKTSGPSYFAAYNPEVISDYIADTAKMQQVDGNTQNSVINLTYHSNIVNQHLPLFVDVEGHGYSQIPVGYVVASGQRSGHGPLLIQKQVPMIESKPEFVTRTVTIFMPNGRQRTIRQRALKGTKFGRVAVPHLHGYTMKVTGSSQDLGPASANINTFLTVRYVR